MLKCAPTTGPRPRRMVKSVTKSRVPATKPSHLLPILPLEERPPSGRTHTPVARPKRPSSEPPGRALGAPRKPAGQVESELSSGARADRDPRRPAVQPPGARLVQSQSRPWALGIPPTPPRLPPATSPRIKKEAPGQWPGAYIPDVVRSVIACQHSELPGSSQEEMTKLNTLYAR